MRYRKNENKMMRKALIFLLISMSLYSVKAQSLRGVVSDSSNGETIPMANVVVKSGQTIVQGGATDFDGQYIISPLNKGTYTIEVSYIGYQTKTVKDVVIDNDKGVILNCGLLEASTNITCCTCGYSPLMISDYSGEVFGISDIQSRPVMR